ncbi:MAG: NADPH-dependent F420 reductase [Nitrososphaerota archaeon]
MSSRSDIGVLGGTAGLGKALALRLVKSGCRVSIGSRSLDRALAAAKEVNDRVGGELAIGDVNENVAASSDIVFFAIPFIGVYELARKIKTKIRDGGVAVSCMVPLESDMGGSLEYFEPSGGSAAETLQNLLGQHVKVVSALTYMPTYALEDIERPVECDVAVCGEREPSKKVMEVLSLIEGVRPLYAGALKYSRITERLTVLLIRLNKEYCSDRAGLRFTYI